MKRKPDEPEPPEPTPDEPAQRTMGDAKREKLEAQLRAPQDAAAKAALAAGLGPANDPLSAAKALGGLGENTLAASGLADIAKSLGGVTDSATADIAKSLKGVTDSPWAAGFDAPKLADLRDALAGSNERWAGLIGQAAETAKMAHEWAQPAFTVPESPLEAYLRENPPELGPIAVQPNPLPGMSAELSRVSGLVAVMADNVVVMAGLGQRAEEALLRLEVEASQTRAETERLRAALVDGQHSAGRLSWINLFATVVLVALTIVIAYLTYKLKPGG